MKIVRIFTSFLLFNSAASLPRFFNNLKWKKIRTIGNRGPGMTTTSIRSYFDQERLRKRIRDEKSTKRIHNILDAYLAFRDTQ